MRLPGSPMSRDEPTSQPISDYEPASFPKSSRERHMPATFTHTHSSALRIGARRMTRAARKQRRTQTVAVSAKEQSHHAQMGREHCVSVCVASAFYGFIQLRTVATAATRACGFYWLSLAWPSAPDMIQFWILCSLPYSDNISSPSFFSWPATACAVAVSQISETLEVRGDRTMSQRSP